jgi:hypothetical protein
MVYTEELSSPLHIDAILESDSNNQLSDLLDRCFQVRQGQHFLDDFPVWNSALLTDSVNHLGIFRNRQLVASVSIRLAQMKCVGTQSIPIAILGAVATHPDWRRKGLASKLIASATQWAEEKGASLILLWGTDYSLYSRHGFEFFGQQVQVPLKSLPPVSSFSLSIHQGWNPGLFPWIQKRSEGLILDQKDLKWFESHKNTDWFWTGNAEKPDAYVAMNRGIDLANLIHEWGGSIDQIKEIFYRIREVHPEAKVLANPRHMKSLGIDYNQVPIEFLGMAKIVDPAKLLSAHYPHISVSSQVKQGKWFLEFGASTFQGLSSSDLVRLLLEAPGDDIRTGGSLLPLSLWVWGLDAA